MKGNVRKAFLEQNKSFSILTIIGLHFDD
jgi:hypothetical protein